MIPQNSSDGRSVRTAYHWYHKYRFWATLLAIASFLLVSTIAMDPTHAHATNARPCDICLAAHLPFVQPAVPPVVLALAPSYGEGLVALTIRPVGISPLAAESRGPPA